MSELREALEVLRLAVARHCSTTFPGDMAESTHTPIWHVPDSAFGDLRRAMEASAALATTPEPAGLDEAWRKAEAALPERHGGLHLGSTGDWGEITGYVAYAFAAQKPTISATGPTPAEALNALAARLKESER